MSQEELFEKYISATLTLEDKEELKEVLKNDKKAGREFAEYIQDTAMYLSVAEELALHEKAVDLDKVSKSSTASFKVHKSASRTTMMAQNNSKTAIRVAMAIAAAFVVAGVLFFNFMKSSRHVADIASANKISLDRAGLDLTFGDKSFILKGDRITALDDISISVKENSTILMSKGAVCEIDETDSGMKVTQIKGRSEYIVSEQLEGKNFKVLTDRSRTTVIGTRFTVDANAERSKIRVTDGLVKVDDLKSLGLYVNPGEFAVIDSSKTLTKKVAYQTMLINKFVKDAKGGDYNVEGIEEKPYLILLYAENWDPASRSFVHKLKKYYEANNSKFEVVFMNNNNDFAADYEMPWACIDAQDTKEVESLIGDFNSSFSLNLVLIDQHGNVIAKSAKGKEWLGSEAVLNTLSSNLER